MNEKGKRIFSKIYSILVVILAAAMVLLSITPIMVLNSSRFELDEKFYTGRFTSKSAFPKDIKIGVGTIFTLISNFGDMQTVMGIQSYDATIEELEDEIDEIESAENVNERALEKAEEKLAEEIEGREQVLADLSEEDLERVEEKLQNDEDFINLIATMYSFGGFTGDAFDDSDNSTSGTGMKTLPITKAILSIILLIVLFIYAVVFVIILVIKFIILLVKFFCHLKDTDSTNADSNMDRFPFTVYAGVMAVFFTFLYLVSPVGMSMGSAIVGSLIILVVSSVLRAVKNILFAKKNRVELIVKKAVTVVSIVAAVVFLFSFTGVGLINELDEATPGITSSYLSELDDIELSEAKDKVAAANGRNTAIIVTATLVGAMLIVIAAINTIERFGDKKQKLKTGEMVAYKAMPVLAIFLIIVSIVPTFFGAGSKDALEEAYEKGNFKVYYEAYKDDETLEKRNYDILVSTEESLDDLLAESKENLKSAEGEAAEELSDQIEEFEYIQNTAKDMIKEIETQKTKATLCIVAAVIFAVAEFVYLFCPKFFVGKAEEAEEESEAPVDEETSAEAEEESVASEDVAAEAAGNAEAAGSSGENA